MAAGVQVVKVVGESPGTEHVVTGVSLMSSDDYRDTLSIRLQGPIDVPSGDASYSYQTYLNRLSDLLNYSLQMTRGLHNQQMRLLRLLQKID